MTKVFQVGKVNILYTVHSEKKNISRYKLVVKYCTQLFCEEKNRPAISKFFSGGNEKWSVSDCDLFRLLLKNILLPADGLKVHLQDIFGLNW